MRLAGKVALVSGSTRGIGRSIAHYLASDEAAFVTGSMLTADGGFTVNAGRLTD